MYKVKRNMKIFIANNILHWWKNKTGGDQDSLHFFEIFLPPFLFPYSKTL